MFFLSKCARKMQLGIARSRNICPRHVFYTTETDRIPNREASVAVLKASHQAGDEFDLLIIGGGSVGSGAALDAAARGLKVACVERSDFGAGTSSRSTKLIWGGSRYLVEALVNLLSPALLTSPVSTVRSFLSEFRMVLNCHRERNFLLLQQPHLTHWLPIAVPITSWVLWPPPFRYPPAALGPLGLFPLFFKFYDLLGGLHSPPSHVMTPARTLRKFPQLAVRGSLHNLKYCSVFYEGQFDDARTNLAIALTAAREGAVMGNYCDVQRLIFDSPPASSSTSTSTSSGKPGKVRGAQVTDRITGESFEVRAKSVLLCGGPFTDELRRQADPSCEAAVKGSGGVHIVLPGYLAPSNFGLVDMSTSDGRFLFMLPWLGHVLVGTTDSPDSRPSMTPRPDEEEILWLLKECSKYLSADVKIRRHDVLSAWKGIRPLARDPHARSRQQQAGGGGTTAAAASTSSVSRDHVISHDPQTDLVFASGGKWTTYREMAEDAVDRVIEVGHLHYSRDCRTLDIGLVGKEGYSANLPITLVQDFNIPFAVAKHLADSYGGRAGEVCRILLERADEEGGEEGGRQTTAHFFSAPAPRPVLCERLVAGYPYLLAEVKYSCRCEWARRVEDVIARRLRLLFINKEAAREAIPLVAAIMQQELGWSDSQLQSEMQRAGTFLDSFGGPQPLPSASPCPPPPK